MPTLRHTSLAVKLPIAIALLVLLTCGAVIGAAYLHVRAAAFNAADERLSGVADQIGTILALPLGIRAQSLQVIADGAAVKEYVAAPTAEREAAVRAVLAALPAPADRHGFRLFTGRPHAAFETDGWKALPTDASWMPPPTQGGRNWSFSPISRSSAGEGLYFEIVASIARGDGSTAHLVERRWLGPAAPGIQVLLNLIGTDAKLFVGNAGGEIWADFEQQPVAAPAEIDTHLVTVTFDDRAYAVRGKAVPGTPWVVAVALPLDPVVAAVRQFLMQAGTMTAIIVGAAALLGWALSRRITVPLRALAASAERIDNASPGDRLPQTGDEVARLSASFTAMSQRVEDGRRELAALVADLEDRVRQRTEALEATNKELEAFSYSVSHDLRAPVRAISGFATILAADHAESMTDDAKRCVEVITRRSRQMGQLIDDLLAFSRVGRQRLSLQKVDMGKLAAAVVDEVRAAHPSRRIEFVVGDLPAVEGESSLLQQALANLVQNAVKFSAPRDPARIEIGWQDGDREDVFFVRDNGVGFDMQYVDKLFGVFQRLHRADEFEGTGVGLAIVLRVAQRHGGRAWADGTVDGGATFYFSVGRDRKDIV